MRYITPAFEATQIASTRTSYIHLLFTSANAGTTYDYSSDQQGSRILLIDHSEEQYNDYAIIVLRNNDRTVPNMIGYWTEIGYGYVTTTGNEYVGDGTNTPGVPRLWIKHQQLVSAGGRLYTILELEGMMAKAGETVMRKGNPPYYDDLPYTATVVYDILSAVLTDLGFTLSALGTQDDNIINAYDPVLNINGDPFETALAIIERCMRMTKCYLRPKSGLAFEIRYPQTTDEVNESYYSAAPYYFISHTERTSLIIPNHYIVFANEGTGLITSEDAYGKDQDSIDAYGTEVRKLEIAT